MTPRKKESKKWTKMPTDFSNQIKTVFEENFKSQLEGNKLQVDGWIYPTEILLRVGINYKGELRFHNFEVSLDHSQIKKDTIAQIHLGVDAIASLMVDFFENDGEHEMPLSWQEYPFEKQKIWLQYSSENQDLEAEANRLLGLAEGSEILNDPEDSDEEIEKMIEDLEQTVHSENSEDQEEDLDLKTPQIFKKNPKKKDHLH